MEGATNTRPSSNNNLEEEPLKTKEKSSESSERFRPQLPGTWNIICECEKVIATGQPREDAADDLLDKHQEKTGCGSSYAKQVKARGGEPGRYAYSLLMDALKNCSKETKAEVREELEVQSQ